MSDKEEEQPAQGFDRGVNYEKMKKKLINKYNDTWNFINNLDPEDRCFQSKKKINIGRLIYQLIAMIQLINGSRISEAVDSFYKFINNGDFEKHVTVKIAKSKSTKYKKYSKEKYITKTRFRKMKFPNKWIEIKYLSKIKYYLEHYTTEKKLKKRVLAYLLRNLDSNTHSLRYAYINFMLYTKKEEMGKIAKHIGHSNINQLIRYTQQLEADKLFDLDI